MRPEQTAAYARRNDKLGRLLAMAKLIKKKEEETTRTIRELKAESTTLWGMQTTGEAR